MNPRASLQRLRRRYRSSLPQRIAELENALRGLEDGDFRAADAIRQIANQLIGSGGTFGFPEITEASRAVGRASDHQLMRRTEELVDVLARVASTGEAEDGLVLVLEQDPDIVAFIAELLESAGREAGFARTTEEAAQIMDRERIDAILIDLHTPTENPLDIIQAIKQSPATSSIPVGVLSLFDDDAVRADVMAAGASAFITKPIDPDAFVASVANLLDGLHGSVEEADVDRLTGLAGPSSARAVVDEILSYPEARRHPTSIVVLRVDDVRALRAQSAEAADEVLRQLTKWIAPQLRTNDLFARWGEDTFLVVMPGLPGQSADEQAERWHELARRKWVILRDGESFRVSFRWGIRELYAGDDLDEAIADVERNVLVPPAEPQRRESPETGQAKREIAARHRGTRSIPRDALVDQVTQRDPAARAAANGENIGTPNPRQRTRRDGPRSILIADDDPLVTRLVKHKLEKADFEVVTANDGRSALSLATSGDFSLIILDVKMPGMDGFEVLARIRAHEALARVPIVMLTSMGREEDIIHGLELGADDYILKPFSPNILIARLRRLLRRTA